MIESKISTSKSAWGDFSSINTSSAPGFIPVPCPTHQQYSITNICKSPKCIEPLCPQCIADHVKLHEQTKKPAKIENIITTRITCIEQLAVMKYQANKQYEQSIKNSSGNIQEYIDSQRNKLVHAHKNLQKYIDDFFLDMYSKMDVLASAFQQQKAKKQNETKLKLSPLHQYLKNISQYKNQLESEDYIPALIELLNQPPRKPTLQNIDPIDNFGAIQITEKYFEQLKTTLNKFIKANIKNSNNRINIDKNNYSTSNNMRFSRFDRSRSRSRDNVGMDSRFSLGFSRNGSQQNMENVNRKRSNSKKKIFGSQSIVSEIQSDHEKYGVKYY